ncbi:MAG: MFS transporter [Chloroflexota bacterium]
MLASTILANTASRMTRPFLPLYIVALGGTVAEVGVFFTIHTLSAAVLRPFGGWFSDSIGRIQAVALGAIFTFLGTLGYALSPTWGWLAASAVIMAFGRGVVGPSYKAYIAEAAPPGQTAQTYGLVNGLFTICQIVGPLLGGWLAAQYELRFLFWVGVGLTAVATLLRIYPGLGLTYRWENVRLAELKQGFRGMATALVAGGLLTWLFITDTLRDIGIQLYENLQPLLMEAVGMGEAQIGTFFSFYAVIYLIVSWLGGKLADRWSAAAVLALSGILHALILFVLALFTTIPTFWLFAFITAVAFGIGDPAFDAFLAKATPPERLGLTFGLFDTALSFFTTPFPYLGGLLWEQVLPTTPFWVGGLFLAVAGVVTWYWIRPFEKM